MRDIYRNALTEVNAIINNSEKEIINKIPNRFMNFIQSNMNTSYVVEINPNKEILEQNISKEAKSIIGLIFRDYICSKDERQKLIKIEIDKARKKEEMKKRIYTIKW